MSRAITNEPHTVPALAPYRVTLAEIPLAGSVVIPGFSPVAFAPSAGYYRVLDDAAPMLEFHASAAGEDVLVSYEGLGAYVAPEPEEPAAPVNRIRARLHASGLLQVEGEHSVETGVHADRVLRLLPAGNLVTFCGGARPRCEDYVLQVLSAGTEPALRYTDFREATAGSLPPGWAEAEGAAHATWAAADDAGAAGGRVLRYVALSSSTYVGGPWWFGSALWTALGTFSDGEIAARFRISFGAQAQRPVGLRMTTANPFNGYALETTASTTSGPVKRQNGAFYVSSTLGNAPSGSLASYVAGQWVGIAVRVSGNQVRVMTWLWDENAANYGRPGAFAVTVNDGTVGGALAAGYAGLSADRNALGSNVVDFDRVGVARAAATHAPLEAPAPGTVTVSGLYSDQRVRLDGGSLTAPDGAGTATLTLQQNPQTAGALVELCDEDGIVQATAAGTFWNGASLAVVASSVALATGQGRAFLKPNGLRVDAFTPGYEFAP